MINVNAKFVNKDRKLRDIGAFRTNIGVTTAMLERYVVPELRGTFKKQFDQEGAYLNGSEWKSLADSTVKQRIALGFGGRHPILQRTGTLMRSFIGKGMGHLKKVVVAGGIGTVEVGSILKVKGGKYLGSILTKERPISTDTLPLEVLAKIRANIAGYLDKFMKKGL